jgi:hypothetical protein
MFAFKKESIASSDDKSKVVMTGLEEQVEQRRPEIGHEIHHLPP